MTRIGSLCTGYGGLDLAVQAVFGGTVAWHCQYEPPDKHGREDTNQYAAQILAHHWPHIPNHGDLTAVDWDQVEPVDILTAGFPCQDVSLAGLRAGLADGTRSGLWLHVARAIEALQPRLVVIENVRGLLSAKADSGMEPCTWCVGDAGGEPPLRALGAVLADLARLRFDAEWQVVRGRVPSSGRRHEPAAHDLAAAHADRRGLPGHGELSAERDAVRQPERDDVDGRYATAADTAGVGEREPTDEAVAVAGSRDTREVLGGRSGALVADAEGDGRNEGRTEPAGQQGRLDAPLGGVADVQWGEYEPAIRRWERALGRPAPRPTDDRGRLSPAFVEWMMGLPAGHVTSVPGIPRGAQLKALGNGVVPQQAAAAIRVLAARAGLEVAA